MLLSAQISGLWTVLTGLRMATVSVVAVVMMVVAVFVVADAGDTFTVKGRVYCDNCHTGFPTRISPSIAGAKVAVQCATRSGTQTLYTEGVSDSEGQFAIPVKGERAQELCKTVMLSSPSKECDIPSESNHGPVFLTHNNGIHDDDRMTGPFAFQSSQKHPECAAVMAEYNY